MDKLTRKQKDFANELVIQGMKSPADAVLTTDSSVLTTISAEQLSAKHLAQPAVRQLIDEIIDNRTLITRHMELLSQKQTVVTWDSKNERVVSEETNLLDPNIALKALDLAYKLKGMYAPEQSQRINVNMDVKNNPAIDQITQEYEEKLREMFSTDKTQ